MRPDLQRFVYLYESLQTVFFKEIVFARGLRVAECGGRVARLFLGRFSSDFLPPLSSFPLCYQILSSFLLFLPSSLLTSPHFNPPLEELEEPSSDRALPGDVDWDGQLERRRARPNDRCGMATPMAAPFFPCNSSFSSSSSSAYVLFHVHIRLCHPVFCLFHLLRSHALPQHGHYKFGRRRPPPANFHPPHRTDEMAAALEATDDLVTAQHLRGQLQVAAGAAARLMANATAVSTAAPGPGAALASGSEEGAGSTV